MCLYIEGRSISNLVRRTPTANSRLVYAQTAVKHKEYFDYVFSFFLPFCANDYKPQSRIVVDNRTKKTYSAISFTTMQLPCFNEYRELFYDLNRKKIIPENIRELLTPRGLAFLIMDDGTWVAGSKSVRIATNNFTYQEVDLLRNILETKYSLQSTRQLLSKKGGNTPKDKYSLYIKVASMPRLRELVLPYMCPSMKYKLGLVSH